jgi:hypothetical protein
LPKLRRIERTFHPETGEIYVRRLRERYRKWNDVACLRFTRWHTADEE